MECPYYAEQKYMYAGYVEAKILTAQEAEILGYEDGYVDSRDNCKVYVDGFDSKMDARRHLEDLTDCHIINWQNWEVRYSSSRHYNQPVTVRESCRILPERCGSVVAAKE